MILLHIIFCVLVADFLSGLLHWFEDTYAIPLEGFEAINKHITSQNIEHHREPGLITKGTYWSTVKVSVAIALSATFALYVSGITCWQLYLIIAITSQANQTHKWAHTKRVPKVVALLQRVGILQSVGHHAKHHRNPYMIRYCTVTNLLNPVLDKLNVWRGFEALLPLPVMRGSVEREGY